MARTAIPLKTLRNGFSIPLFGVGTWGMGGRAARDPKNDDAADIEAIRAALAAGVTHIDTAELYAAGHAEELVREAVKGLDRTKLFLVSKARGEHFAPDDLLRACEGSLRRLGTSYLDLYLLHWYEKSPPLRETVRALDGLVRRGLVKHIGVSNFAPTHLAEAQQYAEHKIVCDQVHYNLIFREPERKKLLEYCAAHDVMLVAWRPVEKGKLTDASLPLMKELTAKYRKTPAQIAINWLVSQPNVVTIAKSRSKRHLLENLGGFGWSLSPEDIERLRAEFPGQEDVSDAVPLE